MVHAQALDLVERNQDSCEEEFVLLFQRQGEAIDNGPKYLEQLSNSIEPLSFICELEEDIVDRSANEGPEVEELPIDAVQRRLEEIPFSWVLRVEQFEKLENEAVVDICLGDVGIEVLALDESEEEFINDLDVRPGNLQNRLVLLRVKGLSLRVHWRRNRTEEVLGKHLDDTRVHGFGNDLSIISDIVQQLVKRQPFDLLCLHITTSIVKVEDDIALVDLVHEQVLSAIRCNFVETRQFFKLALSRDFEAR